MLLKSICQPGGDETRRWVSIALGRGRDKRTGKQPSAKATRSGRATKTHMEVVRGVSVERLLEELLVEEVADETDRPTEDEQSVEGSDLEVVGSLLLSERAGAVEQIAEDGGEGLVDDG